MIAGVAVGPLSRRPSFFSAVAGRSRGLRPQPTRPPNRRRVTRRGGPPCSPSLSSRRPSPASPVGNPRPFRRESRVLEPPAVEPRVEPAERPGVPPAGVRGRWTRGEAVGPSAPFRALETGGGGLTGCPQTGLPLALARGWSRSGGLRTRRRRAPSVKFVSSSTRVLQLVDAPRAPRTRASRRQLVDDDPAAQASDRTADRGSAFSGPASARRSSERARPRRGGERVGGQGARTGGRGPSAETQVAPLDPGAWR